jgi:hypothetical protein
MVAGMLCFVVAAFYWAGWELGAIEAISLSILVGSSVDYCVHIVEGYILAGRNPLPHVAQVSEKQHSNNGKQTALVCVCAVEAEIRAYIVICHRFGRRTKSHYKPIIASH